MPLKGLTSLNYLDLTNNAIHDLTPLAECSALTRLFVGINHIQNIEPLRSLSKLEVLDIRSNAVSDL